MWPNSRELARFFGDLVGKEVGSPALGPKEADSRGQEKWKKCCASGEIGL